MCCDIGDSTVTSNRASDWYMSTSVCSSSIIVGNRCSLRGLHATQHNRCVLESRRLHPSKHKFSLRLSCSGKYWQLIEPPIIVFLISGTPIREPHTPVYKKIRLGQRDSTLPSRTAVCGGIGDSTLTSNRALDLYVSTSVCSIPITVGHKRSLRGLLATQHNCCVLESRRPHFPKHKSSRRLSRSSKSTGN